MEHRINKEYTLKFYGCDQGIHMMVYQDGEPLTCKKERLKPLRDFLAQENGVAFKGGLKLVKTGESVVVSAKKQELPAVPVAVFYTAIEQAKDLEYYESKA